MTPEQPARQDDRCVIIQPTAVFAKRLTSVDACCYTSHVAHHGLLGQKVLC